jgi:hypothetical protein
MWSSIEPQTPSDCFAGDTPLLTPLLTPWSLLAA